jgi:serine phosphatase RsbU (regulator of sigma subunit)
MKSWELLLESVIFLRLQENPSYRITSDKGDWICPHCLIITGVHLQEWDGTNVPAHFFVPSAFAHLRVCEDYKKSPLAPRSPEEIANSRGERGIRMELLKRVQLDPLFQVTDDMGTWICPFSMRAIQDINVHRLPWGPALEEKIVEYLLTHECPGRYQQWKPETTLAEMQRLAGRLSAQRSHAEKALAAEGELRHLRQRVEDLSQRAASAEEMKADLEAARKVQMKMLPAQPPHVPGYEIAAFYEPCIALGGDLYNFLEPGPGCTGLLVGDVSGHGVAAAVIMAMAQKSFGVRSTGIESPSEVICDVNRDLAKDMQHGRFVSAFYGVLDHVTGTLRYCRAGHPPSYIVHADGTLVSLEGKGLALGLGTPETFARVLEEREAVLPMGSLLLMFTDGISEAMNAEKDEYTLERVRQTLTSCATLSAQETMLAVLTDVRDHVGPVQMDDDITLIVVRRLFA